MLEAVESIKQQQRDWAQKNRISYDSKGYVHDVNCGLYEPLKSDSAHEFQSGAGRELDNKMRALHSSSALVCNFFHYWRYRDIMTISSALGLHPHYTGLRFEKTYKKPSGIGGKLPHVDVEISNNGCKPVAIEAKFTEPYSRRRKLLKSKYAQVKGIWGKFVGCATLADRIVNGAETFEYFDAPQILKHILGLRTEYGEDNFQLVYLYYVFACEEFNKHKTELAKFLTYVADDLQIQIVTYQDAFSAVKKRNIGTNSNYINYMKERYF